MCLLQKKHEILIFENYGRENSNNDNQFIKNYVLL